MLTTGRVLESAVLPRSALVPCGSDLEYEIIVVDDNSPDGTQAIVKRLQDCYGRDKIVSTS